MVLPVSFQREDSAAAVDISTEASGLLMLRKHHFFEVGGFLLKVLGALKPANAILQANSVDLCCAGEVVSASLQALREKRDDESLTDFDRRLLQLKERGQ